MKIQSIEKDIATIQFSGHELLALNNALSEVCHGLKILEFKTQIGVSRERTEKLLGFVHEMSENVTRDRTKVVEKKLELSKDDLIILENSLAEVLEVIEEWEFQTRIGVEIKEAEDLKIAIEEMLLTFKNAHSSSDKLMEKKMDKRNSQVKDEKPKYFNNLR